MHVQKLILTPHKKLTLTPHLAQEGHNFTIRIVDHTWINDGSAHVTYNIHASSPTDSGQLEMKMSGTAIADADNFGYFYARVALNVTGVYMVEILYKGNQVLHVNVRLYVWL